MLLVGIIVGIFIGMRIESDAQITDPPPSTLAPSASNRSVLPLTPLDVYDNAAVSSDAKPCAEIGSQILSENGSAVDSAIATLFCVGVYNAHSMGLGGGFLMTIYIRNNRTAYALDARESAPLAATEDMFRGNASLSSVGALAIAVPGELKGYWEAHQRFGHLPWAQLVKPTIKICEDGHPVSRHMANAIRGKRDYILSNPLLSEVYVDPKTRDVKKFGDIVKRPRLAKTLREIAANGASVLYTGELAKKFVQDIQDAGGIITMEDLKAYKPKLKEPVITKLGDGTWLYGMPPPGSGVLYDYIMGILDGYRFNPSSVANTKAAILTYHRIIESFKFAYAKRTLLGDEDFIDISQLIRNLTSGGYAEETRKKIDDFRTYEPAHYGATVEQPEDHGTAHVSVLAPNGDAVSCTSTINLYFGSMVVSQATGIILNDEMDDFSAPNITSAFGIPPSPSNFIKPGKRPLSSMVPTIIVDKYGDVRMVTGAAGGTQITSSVAYVTLRNLWFQEDIKTATEAARLHHQLFPNAVMYEPWFSRDVLDGLEMKGHELAIRELAAGFAVVVSVTRGPDGKIYANSDFRKGGGSSGF